MLDVKDIRALGPHSRCSVPQKERCSLAILYRLLCVPVSHTRAGDVGLGKDTSIGRRVLVVPAGESRDAVGTQPSQ